MNTLPASVLGKLDRLSTGVSRTSIRHYATPKLKKKKHHLTGFTPGHGERIFVYNHTENGMIVYAHEPELKVRLHTCPPSSQLLLLDFTAGGLDIPS